MLYKALIAACAVVAGCSTSPPAPDVAGSAVRTADAALPPAGCVAQSATRIPVGPSECVAAGHIWTGRAIQSTGATEPGAALRLLDPTVNVQGQ
jgi:hypothetical protein